MNPFNSIPDPAWDYYEIWTSLALGTDQLHEIAKLLRDCEEGNTQTDEAVALRLERALAAIEKALKDLKS